MQGLPLRVGATGPAVTDLRRRLGDAGFGTDQGQQDSFDAGTEKQVRAFQRSRGLEVDGVCGTQTWAALLEAGYVLGSRNLYLSSPMLRGDDVAELQQRLGALGFDAGRVDGIFGPDTASAVQEFQRNVGLTADGICGRDTFDALARLGERGNPDTVAGVREREGLLAGAGTGPIVLGDLGGASTIAEATRREVADTGLEVIVLSQPDPSAQARSANRVEAGCLLGMSLTPDDRRTIAYFETRGFRSSGGAALAELLAGALSHPLGPVRTEGMRLPLLRESRMPAVACKLGPAGAVVERTHEIATAICQAILGWSMRTVEG